MCAYAEAKKVKSQILTAMSVGANLRYSAPSSKASFEQALQLSAPVQFNSP